MSTIEKETTSPILIDIPMPIETPRLILRNVMPGDGKILFAATEESRAEVGRWESWVKDISCEADEEKVAREEHAKFIKRENMMILGFCKESGEHVVSTGLHNPRWDLRIFDIGYFVRTSRTGRGYATEAANALTRYAFGALAASKVAISMAGTNAASARVVEKLGFEKEGVFRNCDRLPDGSVRDTHWYARFDTHGLPDLDVRWP